MIFPLKRFYYEFITQSLVPHRSGLLLSLHSKIRLCDLSLVTGCELSLRGVEIPPILRVGLEPPPD